GGVLPVSAFVARREVMDVFTPGSHGSTFGGNPLAAAVGLEALHVIRDEGLGEKSRVLGAHMLARLGAVGSPALQDVAVRGSRRGWGGGRGDRSRRRERGGGVRAPAGERRAVEGDAPDGRSPGAAARHRARGPRLGARSLRGSPARARRHAARAGGVNARGSKKSATGQQPPFIPAKAGIQS